MNINKTQYTIKTAVAAVCVAASMSAIAATTPASQSAQVLYVAHAPSATVQQSQNSLTLTMNKTRLSFFYDRPARKAGKQTVASFVNDWKNGKNSFASNHPNAAFIAKSNGKTVNEFITLSNPVINSKTQQLTFTVTPLSNQPSVKPGSYQHISLFIDNASPMNCTMKNINSIGCL